MSKDSAMAVATGAPAPVEAPAAAAPVETPAQLQSTPFSQLAKKEAEIVRQRSELKKEQEIMRSEKDQIHKIKSQYDEYQATKAQDPVKALKMLGFSETDIFNYMAANQPEELTPEQKTIKVAEAAAEAKIKSFEENQANRLKAEQAEQDKSLIQGYRGEVSKVIKSNPDEFRYCNHFGPAADAQIYEYVLAVAQVEGVAITPLQAAKEIEKYYEDEDMAMDKIRRKPTPPPVEKPKAEPERTRTVSPAYPGQEPAKPVVTRTRSLSNATTSTVAATRHVNNESREAKRERLINALRNGA